jgi:superfamily I DNA/RNA helicase
MNDAAVAQLFARFSAERSAYVEKIVSSISKKKLVVAGPGTGKTYLFREILRNKPKSLTLTFINALVADLSLELGDASEVCTLHSYAKQLLGKLKKAPVRIFPKLSQVIQEDAVVLLKKQIDFNKLFHERDDSNEHIGFYAKRKRFYGDFYGYTDVIFALAICLEKRRDKIPAYQQVVVDEFQDFNRLEVSLIDLLAEKSPVLLAGDDDQALYEFKQASSEHIRRRHSEESLGFQSFELPFCSRCPRVIVEAANDIVKAATSKGHLKGRIAKRYEYFEERTKNAVCDSNPKITYAYILDKRIPWFIHKQIERIAKTLRKAFSVLIISPFSLQSSNIATALKKKGFGRVESGDKRADDPTLLDGLKLLSEDQESNLGWRIVAKSLLEREEFESLLKDVDKKETQAIHNFMSANHKSKVSAMLKVVRKLRAYKSIEEEHLPILHGMNVDFFDLVSEAMTENFALGDRGAVGHGIRNIHIKTTTIQSSKGLAAEYVFITHFDDRYFIGQDASKVSDQHICNFLVALTRAKNKVFLISCKDQDPTFLQWIDKRRIDRDSK